IIGLPRDHVVGQTTIVIVVMTVLPLNITATGQLISDRHNIVSGVCKVLACVGDLLRISKTVVAAVNNDDPRWRRTWGRRGSDGWGVKSLNRRHSAESPDHEVRATSLEPFLRTKILVRDVSLGSTWRTGGALQRSPGLPATSSSGLARRLSSR